MSDEAKTARRALTTSRRVVVKIGSRALAASGDIFDRIADEVRLVSKRNKRRVKRSVVIVSSGAIALGIDHLEMKGRPRAMAGLQAAAATGQSLLMQRWGDAFAKHRIPVAQVLLTHADLASRGRANNARAAITRLLELGVVPVINENDAVAVDEIRCGDNDALASMVTPLCDGDLLLLLSDVPGLLDGRRERVPYLPHVDDEALGLVRRTRSTVSSGGMGSKLESARRAALAGANVVIAHTSEPSVLRRVLAGKDVGTLVPAVARRLSTRKHWIAYTLRAVGAAIVDAGAAQAVRTRGTSVLCVGVVGVRGRFVPGDAISLVTSEGEEIARGLTRMSAADAARLAGDTSGSSELLIHRDALVLLPG